ncbi:MAG: hypothetical protein ACI376_08605 [Candidatus Bruticola sp.]
MSFNSASFMNLISSVTGNVPNLGTQGAFADLMPQFNTNDLVSIGGFAQLEGSEQAEDVGKAQRENFDQAFTTDDVAALFGKDASELTEQQSADLSNLLFDISQENAKRKEAGESPLTKDELNEYINSSVTDYKSKIAKGEKSEEANEAGEKEQENTLGKTLSELGIEELNDEQIEGINKALNQYENGEKVTAAQDAKEAKEAQAAKEAQEAEKAASENEVKNALDELQKAIQQAAQQQANQSSPTGGSGNVGGSGSVGGSSPVGSTNGASGSASPTSAGETASSSNIPEMAEDLQGLQQQKADAQTAVGDLGSQIDSKKSEINQRKSDIAQGIGTDNLSPEQKIAQAKNQEEYDKAKQDYDRANKEKTKVQEENTQTNQEIAQNQQNLYAKAAEKQAKSAEVSAAQSELDSLTPPSAPSSSDKEAQSAYEAAMAEYEAKKAALQAKVDQLKNEEQAIQDEISQLENKLSNLERKKSTQEQRISNYEAQMTRAQSIMDEKMAAIQEGNPAVKEAIENDEELQALESDISDLESQKAEQESFISQLDNQIALKEKQDSAVQQLQEQQAQANLEEALAEAGNPTGEPKEELLQLPFVEKKRQAVDVTDPEQTDKAIEWAREALEQDPNNEKAQAVLDAGLDYLEQRQASAENAAVDAISNLPDHLKDGANACIQEAIEKADGKNPNDAVRTAIAEYTKDLLNNDELSEEDKALVQTAADATAASVKMDEVFDKARSAQSDVEFYKAVEELPDNAKAEAYALRDSINALDKRGSYQSVTDAYNEISEYLDKNPDVDLDMQTAKSMFGDYGPVALSALQDGSGEMAEQLLNEENYADYTPEPLPIALPLKTPESIPHAGGYTGDTASMYRDSTIDLANKNIDSFSEKYSEVSSGSYSPYSKEWKALSSMAKDAEGWQQLTDEYGVKVNAERNTDYDNRMFNASLSEAALKAMSEPTLEDWMSGSTELGLRLAKSSLNVAQNMATTGWCYSGVSKALGREGISIGGPSAFCAVDELDSKYPDQFVKFTSADITKDQLKELPAGAIVVYGSGSGANGGYHGHIYVSQGNGQETSDHVATVRPERYGEEYYVYFPK